MNQLTLRARPTTDPDIIHSGGEKDIVTARFTAAVNRDYKREGEPDADFIPCVAFKRPASFIEKYVKKGSNILLVGRLQNNNYTNKDGQKVYSFQMIVEKIELLDKKPSENEQGEAPVDEEGYADASNMEDMPFEQNGCEGE